MQKSERNTIGARSSQSPNIDQELSPAGRARHFRRAEFFTGEEEDALYRMSSGNGINA